MEITPAIRKLVNLVDQSYEGSMCLPDFQRDFVWPRDQVADLLRSVLRRYFIGSLLLLRCDPQNPPFEPIFLRGAQSKFNDPQPNLLVLDGQQRLTALVYALTAPDLSLKDSSQRRWFFVDLNLLLEDPYNDEIVFDRTKKDLDGLDNPEVQYQRRILPCTSLISTSDFLHWRDGLDDWLREHEPDYHQIFRTLWRDRWTAAVDNFLGFEVPVVELSAVPEGDSEAIGRVCAIFEKLNSTGIELSVYDLLTARLYRSKVKLHDLWNEACCANKRLAEWSDGKAETNKFGVLLLRTVALLRGLEVRPRVLINLDSEGFVDDWRRAAAAVERALELLTLVGPDGFGVFDRKWLPYYGLIPVLAALRAEIEKRGLGDGPRADLRRWYWSNIFLERYSSAVESKSRKDFAEMMAYWLEGKQEPAVFVEAKARICADSYSIRDSASTASTVYSGAFCLLALRGARDWRLRESIQLQELQDHHIFPRAYLNRHSISTRVDVNSIVNRTLISDGTNNIIKDQAPAKYLANPAVFAGGDTEVLLSPHFINQDALKIMRKASEPIIDPKVASLYKEFMRTREDLIIEEIRRACGLL